MIDFIITLCIVVVLAILALLIFGMIATSYWDWKYPPKPEELQKRWASIYPNHESALNENEGDSTMVYHYVKSGDVVGKVVKQPDGLYRATMWNGSYKEFLHYQEAKKSVENYQPIIVK